MNKYGVLEKVTIVSEEDGQTVRSKKKTIVKAKPGVSPLLMGKMLLANSVFLRLSDMSESLPDYEEEVVELKMSKNQAEAYKSFENDMKQALMQALAVGDNSLLGAYLNALLSYPDRIFQASRFIIPVPMNWLLSVLPFLMRCPKKRSYYRL